MGNNFYPGLNAMSRLKKQVKARVNNHLLLFVASSFLLNACSMTTSPLHSMIRDNRDQEAIQVIERKEMVNDRDQMGYTPLHIAAIRGNLNLSKVLLKNGAELNARDFHGRTAFMLSVREGNKELSRYFLDQGAKLHTNYTLTNALFDAITGQDVEMTEYLLQHGFSVNIMNRTQTTPIHIAAAKGNVEIIDLLIGQGANVNQLDDDGWNALLFAGSQSHRDSVRRLLEAGARPVQLSDSALAAFATGVVYEESAHTSSVKKEFLIAAEHYAKAAAFYESLANQVQEQIEAEHARNALAIALGAFAMAVQPGTPMPTASGGTVRLYQPVVVPIKGTTTLQSARAAYLASMEEALVSEQRCREALTR